MPPWNQSPAALQPKVTPTIQTVDAIADVVKLLVLALIAGFAAYHRVVFLVLAPAPAHVRVVADLLLWGVSALSGMRAINTAYVWKSTRGCQVAQDRLQGKQRLLMGLPPTPSQPLTPSAMALKPLGPLGPAGPQGSVVSPPLRYARTTQGQVLAEPAPIYGIPAATTPLTAGSTGLSRPSPRMGSAAVATPQQLRSYLDGLEVASTGRAGIPASTPGGYATGGTPGRMSLGAYGVSQPYFGGTPASVGGYAATPSSMHGGTASGTPAPLFSAFHHEMPTPTTSGMGGGPSESGTPSMTAAGGYGSAGYGAGAVADAPDVAASPALPFGVELPKYRPSWLPRAKAASAAGGQQEVTEATGQQEASQFLWDVCKVKQEWMEIWTERLREWFATRVLQSLVAVVETAHEGPNALLRKHGQAGASLPPLPSVFESPAAGTAAGSTGAAAAAGMAGRAGAGGGLAGGMAGAGAAQQQVDIEAGLRQVQHLSNMMLMNAAAPANAANAVVQQDAKALAEGVMRYEQLLLLLRGRRPAELLPPAPPGYLWARAQQLSQGTCMPAYNWNGGGAWAGRLWSADLPTDSQLLLYLFSAFIDAPGWEFGASTSNAGASAATPSGAPTAGIAGGTGALGGTPLFLGTVRTTRPPPNYSAILAYRPERPGRGVDAVLALGQQGGGSTAKGAGPGGAGGLLLLPGTSTLFCFLAQGRLLALAGHNALFHALIAFLTYHKVKYNSALGGQYLQDAALQLDAVIEPPKLGAGVVPSHSVFGWWFPPRTHHKHD